MKYGRDEDEWTELTNCATAHLEDIAREKQMTTYGALNEYLVEQTGFAPFDFSSPMDRHAMGHLLFRVVDATRQKGFMLSALVSYGDGSDAGPGFYTLAQDLTWLSRHADEEQRMAFRVTQTNKIYDYYDPNNDLD